MDFISQTWAWYVSGFIIGMVMLLLVYFGKTFGMSSNLRSLCTLAGAGKKVPFFDFDEFEKIEDYVLNEKKFSEIKKTLKKDFKVLNIYFLRYQQNRN